jgi:hypothetical protein
VCVYICLCLLSVFSFFVGFLFFFFCFFFCHQITKDRINWLVWTKLSKFLLDCFHLFIYFFFFFFCCFFCLFTYICICLFVFRSWRTHLTCKLGQRIYEIYQTRFIWVKINITNNKHKIEKKISNTILKHRKCHHSKTSQEIQFSIYSIHK